MNEWKKEWNERKKVFSESQVKEKMMKMKNKNEKMNEVRVDDIKEIKTNKEK